MSVEQGYGVFGVVFAFLIGSNVGSFLNVVAHRVPLGLSVVRPRSRCPACRTAIPMADNIPILSWFVLRGRCRGCKGSISWRYPAVELFTALLAAHVAYSLVVASGRVTDPRAWVLAAAVFLVVAALEAAALIDGEHRILPDAITIPGMWAAPAVAAFVPELVLGAGLETPGWVPASLPVQVGAAIVSVGGIVVGAGVIWGLGALGTKVFKKEAMGFGDVKYLGMIGGYVGPAGALLALVVAACAGTVIGLLRMLVTRDHYIPFGPFLAVGAYVVMLYGGDLIAWYVDHLNTL